MPKVPSNKPNPKTVTETSSSSTSTPQTNQLAAKLKAAGVKEPIRKKRVGPLWKGPEVDGITFSLLSRFLVCRERFRCLVIEGLKTNEGFNAKMEFGNLWHVAEEAFASEKRHFGEHVGTTLWTDNVEKYGKELLTKYPFAADQIEHWHAVTRVMFPYYIRHWGQHPDMLQRKPIFQEKVFNEQYKLPSGRIVRLRGKWDSVDLVDGKLVYIQENKTKSRIERRKIERQMKCDLQTMLYLVAFQGHVAAGKWCFPSGARLAGVRYNVIHRSTHKTPQSMEKKLTEDIRNNRSDEWFLRFNVDVTQADIDRFKQRCLNPILEQLCDWWGFQMVLLGDREGLLKWAEDMFGHYGSQMYFADRLLKKMESLHWQHPFGVYNILDEGGSSDLDEYLDTGSEVGLQRTENLYPELTE